MAVPLTVFSYAFSLTVVMLVLRTIARGDLLAVALLMLLAVGPTAQQETVSMLAAATIALLVATCLIRFGLVAVMAFFLIGMVTNTLRAAFALDSGAGALILLAFGALTRAPPTLRWAARNW